MKKEKKMKQNKKKTKKEKREINENSSTPKNIDKKQVNFKPKIEQIKTKTVTNRTDNNNQQPIRVDGRNTNRASIF